MQNCPRFIQKVSPPKRFSFPPLVCPILIIIVSSKVLFNEKCFKINNAVNIYIFRFQLLYLFSRGILFILHQNRQSSYYKDSIWNRWRVGGTDYNQWQKWTEKMKRPAISSKKIEQLGWNNSCSSSWTAEGMKVSGCLLVLLKGTLQHQPQGIRKQPKECGQASLSLFFSQPPAP